MVHLDTHIYNCKADDKVHSRAWRSRPWQKQEAARDDNNTSRTFGGQKLPCARIPAINKKKIQEDVVAKLIQIAKQHRYRSRQSYQLSIVSGV